MSATKPAYATGDKIFAKIKGYPPWPARVIGLTYTKLNVQKYQVYFYGTGQTAIVRTINMFPYLLYRNQYNKVKTKNFLQAVKEIEYEICTSAECSDTDTASTIEDPGSQSSIPRPDGYYSPISNDDDYRIHQCIPRTPESLRSTSDRTPENLRSTSERTPESLRSTSERTPESLRSTSERTPESLRSTSERTPESLRSTSERTPESLRSTSERTPESLRSTSDTEKNKGKVKKVGVKRKGDSSSESDKSIQIHNKKNKDDTTNEITTNENIQTSKRPSSIDITNQQNISQPILTALGPQKSITIPLYLNQPSNLNENDLNKWKNVVLEFAQRLKARIEMGEYVHNPYEIMDEWTLFKSLEFTNPNVTDSLKTESQLLELDIKIKQSLGLKKVDTRSCLLFLEELDKLAITPLMLKKQPEVVVSIRKIRKYVGNIGAWTMSREELYNFKSDAAKIRETSSVLYKKFKQLFNTPDTVNFWEFFCKEIELFQNKTENMSTKQVLSLVEEP